MTKTLTSLVSTSLATSEIREACAEAQAEGVRSPFFLLVGAGISYPYVPLARDMVEHCKGKAREFSRDELPAALDPLTVYAHWLDRAYPQPQQRRRYLTSLVQDKPISHANFRLAHLLLAESAERLALTDLVISASFDDCLARALGVFGKPFVLCDHPQAAARIDLQDEALKLVHVFGTYPFYDSPGLGESAALNSPSQTAAPRNMTVLVDAILRERSPIVVGYGGWEQDLLMTALRRRLSGSPLQHNLYWFCYRHEDYEALPEWLKEHPNARFVLVQGKLQDEPATQAELEHAVLSEDALEPAEPTPDTQPGLPARLVFEALIQEFDLPEPSVTQDPLQHFIRRLREALPPRLSNDPYELSSVLSRLESLGTEAIPAVTHPTPEATRPAREGVLEIMRQAVRRAQYAAAISAGKAVPAEQLSIAQQEQLAELFLKAAMGLIEDAPERLAAFDAIIALDAPPLRTKPKFSAALGKAYLYKGLTLGKLESADEETVYDQMLARLADAEVSGLKEQLLRAIFARATRLKSGGREPEAGRLLEKYARRLGPERLPALRDQLAASPGTPLPATLPPEIDAPYPPNPGATVPSHKSDSLQRLHDIAMGNPIETRRPIDPRRQQALNLNVNSAGGAPAQPPPAAAPSVPGATAASAVDKKDHVAVHASNKAFEWLLHAKEQYLQGNEAAARHALAQANRTMQISLQCRPDRPGTLGNLAYIQFLNNQRDSARTTLTKAILLGGEALRKRLLDDTRYHPLPHDEAYRKLIESIKTIGNENPLARPASGTRGGASEPKALAPVAAATEAPPPKQATKSR